jgi:hypothetical protein
MPRQVGGRGRVRETTFRSTIIPTKLPWTKIKDEENNGWNRR